MSRQTRSTPAYLGSAANQAHAPSSTIESEYPPDADCASSGNWRDMSPCEDTTRPHPRCQDCVPETPKTHTPAAATLQSLTPASHRHPSPQPSHSGRASWPRMTTTEQPPSPHRDTRLQNDG